MTPLALHPVLAAARRFYAPLIVLLALSLLALWPAGSGVGFVAGMAMGLVLLLHLLVSGASALRTAFPPWLARLCAGAGVVLAIVAAGAPRWRGSAQAIEAGCFLAAVGAAAIILLVLAGRAPTLRDEDW